MAALKEGSFVELVNLVPWGGLDLELQQLRLGGLQGWDGVAAALAREWMADIAKTQVGGWGRGATVLSR